MEEDGRVEGGEAAERKGGGWREGESEVREENGGKEKGRQLGKEEGMRTRKREKEEGKNELRVIIEGEKRQAGGCWMA